MVRTLGAALLLATAGACVAKEFRGEPCGASGELCASDEKCVTSAVDPLSQTCEPAASEACSEHEHCAGSWGNGTGVCDRTAGLCFAADDIRHVAMGGPGIACTDPEVPCCTADEPCPTPWEAAQAARMPRQAVLVGPGTFISGSGVGGDGGDILILGAGAERTTLTSYGFGYSAIYARAGRLEVEGVTLVNGADENDFNATALCWPGEGATAELWLRRVWVLAPPGVPSNGITAIGCGSLVVTQSLIDGHWQAMRVDYGSLDITSSVFRDNGEVYFDNPVGRIAFTTFHRSPLRCLSNLGLGLTSNILHESGTTQDAGCGTWRHSMLEEDPVFGGNSNADPLLDADHIHLTVDSPARGRADPELAATAERLPVTGDFDNQRRSLGSAEPGADELP